MGQVGLERAEWEQDQISLVVDLVRLHCRFIHESIFVSERQSNSVKSADHRTITYPHGIEPSAADNGAGCKFSMMILLGYPINSASCVTPRFVARYVDLGRFERSASEPVQGAGAGDSDLAPLLQSLFNNFIKKTNYYSFHLWVIKIKSIIDNSVQFSCPEKTRTFKGLYNVVVSNENSNLENILT